MIPIISILIGLGIYWANFGWVLTFEPSAALFLSAGFVIMGMLIFLGTQSQKYS